MLADLLSALRALRRAPAFLTAAIFTLALGIGATTAIFTVVDSVLLRPLPYDDAANLVALWSHRSDPTADFSPSYADFRDWRTAVAGPGHPFEDLALARSEGLLLRGDPSAVSVNVAFVSDGFFRVLRGQPMLGRTFRTDEEGPNAPRVIVLGHRLWQSRFAGDRTIIGRSLAFASGEYVVIGVMPAGYEYPGRWADAWAPLAPLAATTPSVAQRLEQRELRVDTRVIGRLGAHTAPALASSTLQSVTRALAAAHPAENAQWSAHMRPLREQLVGTVRRPLFVLLGAVGLLLLVACADVANLSLVRASARGRELALRAALGAGHYRLLRQSLAESLVVAIGGGALGVGFAIGGVALLRRIAPDSTQSGTSAPSLDGMHVDVRVLAFAMLISLATAIVFGIAPALHAIRGADGSSLRDGSRAVSGGAAGRRFRDAITVAQIALTLMLLVGAGLLGRSFIAMRAQDAGLAIERLVTLRIDPLATRYDTPARLVALYDRVRESAAAIPGARSAGIVNHLAMTGAAVVTPIEIAGGPDSLSALFRVADGDYFAAAGISVRRGRALSADDVRRADVPNASDVAAVVSAEFARTAWPGVDALGHRFTAFKQASGRPDFGEPIAAVVVGVAGDVKVGSLTETSPIPTIYLPMTANPWRWATLVVRASGDPAALVAAVRTAARSVDPDLPVASVATGASLIATSLETQRFDLALVIVFAGTALVLATVGVYGVVAQGVVLRSGELAMRSALGAEPRRLLIHVLGGGARLAIGGAVVGVALSLGTTRVLASLLFGVGARDVVTFVGVPVLLIAVALVASVVPARRAARTDAVVVLRGD